MRWRRVKSRDVIDARGGGARPGLPIPLGRVGGGLGLVGLLVVLALQFLAGGDGGGFTVGPGFDTSVRAPGAIPGAEGIPPAQDPQRDLKDFSTYVFTNAQRNWERTFAKDGQPYNRAQLVLYDQSVDTGCGSATSAVGPFYCPADHRVYLDLRFYREMERQLGGGGDFAWAYVIAHEMGHHVQSENGTSDEVRRLEQRDPGDANPLSVRLELQADCLAGVWGHTVFARGDLEQGDVAEAMRTSEAIGDDRLQRQATGSVDPDTFTHGTSAQRRRWFETGYRSGDPTDCDTFSVNQP